MDRVLAEHQPLRDLGVGETVGDESEHLQLASGQPERFGAGRRRCGGDAQIFQCLGRPRRLLLGVVIASRCGENPGELEARHGALKRHAAPRVVRHCVL